MRWHGGRISTSMRSRSPGPWARSHRTAAAAHTSSQSRRPTVDHEVTTNDRSVHGHGRRHSDDSVRTFSEDASNCVCTCANRLENDSDMGSALSLYEDNQGRQERKKLFWRDHLYSATDSHGLNDQEI